MKIDICMLNYFEACGNAKQSTQFINIPHTPFHNLFTIIVVFLLVNFSDVAY